MRRSPLKKVSEKYGEELEKFHRKVKPKWLLEHPGCQVEITPEILCNSINGVTIHHMKGRGKYLNNKRWFLTVCTDCHRKIENNKKWARNEGYILYK